MQDIYRALYTTGIRAYEENKQYSKQTSFCRTERVTFYCSVKSGPLGWKGNEIYGSLRIIPSRTANAKT